jgi:glycosyltransferase involved in cell wall biosynthesis
MVPVSIVIITKNEADIIGRSIDRAKLISHDIVVIDSGSIDGTAQIAREAGCRVYQKTWDGYAANKNKGIELAEHDWILSIDADEIPDDELILTISTLKLDDVNTVYDIKFRSYFGNKQIRFGKWGRDHHIRLFNRTRVRWSESPVHETLNIPAHTRRVRISGNLNHYSVKDVADFKNKSTNYAQLCAQKYYLDGKRSTAVKLYLSPLFNFIKNYIFYRGFLDGRAGLEIATLTLIHTRLKYNLLKNMEQQNVKPISTNTFADEAILVNY